MKRLYIQMINSENQKSHPFGYSEKRFYWMNNFSNVNHKQKKYLTKKDNLEGGIGCFLERIKKENEKEKETEKNILKNKFSKKKKPKYLDSNSQRVIYPEKNTEIKRINKKKAYGNQEDNLLHTTGGRLSSLFNKTPLHFKNKGKRTFSSSMDFGRKKDTNLFSDEFLNDKKYNRIPGV